MQLVDQCNLCGSDNLRPFSVAFARDVVHNSIGRCADCGMFFANPMRSEDELNEFYASEYYEDSGERMVREFPLRVADAKQQLQHDVLALRPPPGRFLEVGCGYGPVLLAARELGYEVVGIEPGSEARAWAGREHGLEVRGEILERCGFEDQSFDVIYAWHVIEHVPDMTRFLKEVRRVLKPGGVFFFGTENYRCIPNRFSRAHHLMTGSLPGLDTADEHTFLFTPKLVCSVFPRFGFAVDMVRAYQPHHKRATFFAPARRGSPLKRAIHYSVLGTVYGLASAWPGGGAHLKAAVRRSDSA
ncbi:MAG: class I SAM-dependent methyltransferase [Burkholderiaceae bacterium]